MSLTLWNADTGNLLHTIKRPTPVRDFTFRPDGKAILAPLNKQLISCEVPSGRVLFEGQTSSAPYATVFYSRDGSRRFATVETPNGVDDDVDHHLRAWETDTGRPLPLEEYQFDTYNGTEELFFFPKGDRFVDLAAQFSVRDVITGEDVQRPPKYRAPQKTAAIMPDGQTFLVGPYLTNALSGKQRRWALPGRRHTFVQDGSTLFSSRHNGLFLIDVAKGTIFWKLHLRFRYGTSDVANSEDGERIVMTSHFGSEPSAPRVLVIDPRESDTPLIIPEYATAVSVTPDHTRFITASSHGIKEWDIATGEQLARLWKPPGRVLFAHYNPSGTRVLVGGIHGHENDREPLDIDDGGWAAVIGTDAKEVVTLTAHSGPVTTGAFSADGRRCATGSMDRTIRLWNSTDGQELHVFRGHLGTIHQVAYSPLGDRVLSAAEDGAAFWNIADAVDGDELVPAIAKTFDQVEVVDARNRRQAKPHESVLFPGIQLGAERPDPGRHRVDWPVIKIGSMKHLTNLPQDWLVRAKVTRRMTPPQQPPKRQKLLGYEQVQRSNDSQRSLYRKQGGRELLVVDADREIVSKWETETTENKAALSPSGNYLANSREVKRGSLGEKDGIHEVTVYHTDSGEPLRTLTGIRCWYLTSIKIDPNEETILLQVDNNSLELRDFDSGELLAEVGNSPGGAGLEARYSLDGRFIITSKYPDPVIHVRDPKTLQEVQSFKNDLPLRWYQLTPDGKSLLAGQQYANHRDLITKWELKRGRRVWSRAGFGSATGKFSNSGRYYLTKSGWKLWGLWDIEVGKLCCVLVHEDHVPTSRFTFEGKGTSLYLAGEEDKRLVWSKD